VKQGSSYFDDDSSSLLLKSNDASDAVTAHEALITQRLELEKIVMELNAMEIYLSISDTSHCVNWKH
jgi:hypothetical protein